MQAGAATRSSPSDLLPDVDLRLPSAGRPALAHYLHTIMRPHAGPRAALALRRAGRPRRAAAAAAGAPAAARAARAAPRRAARAHRAPAPARARRQPQHGAALGRARHHAGARHDAARPARGAGARRVRGGPLAAPPRAVPGAGRAPAPAGAGDVGAGPRGRARRRAPDVGPLRGARRRGRGLRAGRAAARAGGRHRGGGRAVRRRDRGPLGGLVLQPDAQDAVHAGVGRHVLPARAAPAQDGRRHVHQHPAPAAVRRRARPRQRHAHHLGQGDAAVAAQAHDEVQVLRVAAAVPGARVPGLRHRARLPAHGRLRARAAGGGAGRALRAPGGRVRDGRAGRASRPAPRARARVLQQARGRAPLRRAARPGHPHGALPRAVRPVAQAAGRQDQVRQLTGPRRGLPSTWCATTSSSTCGASCWTARPSAPANWAAPGPTTTHGLAIHMVRYQDCGATCWTARPSAPANWAAPGPTTTHGLAIHMVRYQDCGATCWTARPSAPANCRRSGLYIPFSFYGTIFLYSVPGGPRYCVRVASRAWHWPRTVSPPYMYYSFFLYIKYKALALVTCRSSARTERLAPRPGPHWPGPTHGPGLHTCAPRTDPGPGPPSDAPVVTSLFNRYTLYTYSIRLTVRAGCARCKY